MDANVTLVNQPYPKIDRNAFLGITWIIHLNSRAKR
jgi:hypothetical protein